MFQTSMLCLNNCLLRNEKVMKTPIRLFQLFICLTMMADTGLGQSAREINYEGLKIIYKKTPKQVLTASLFIRGGVANITDDQQGLEAIAIRLVMQGGSKSMDKDAFSALSDQLGTNFSSNASNDYSAMTMQCLDVNLDKSWDMFTDAIMNPAMDSI